MKAVDRSAKGSALESSSNPPVSHGGLPREADGVSVIVGNVNPRAFLRLRDFDEEKPPEALEGVLLFLHEDMLVGTVVLFMEAILFGTSGGSSTGHGDGAPKDWSLVTLWVDVLSGIFVVSLFVVLPSGLVALLSCSLYQTWLFFGKLN